RPFETDCQWLESLGRHSPRPSPIIESFAELVQAPPVGLPRSWVMLDALVVSPHPDDAELGMGGTILRLIQQGWSLGILDLTSGEPTPLGSAERRAAETAAANAVLGSPWRQNLGLPNRSLEPNLLHRP